jgi:trk system potassium uptake protein TrkH
VLTSPHAPARARVLAHPARTVSLAFLSALATGTLLLRLPVSTETGGTTFLVALFTATSALSLTGLTVVDTGAHWSTFGECVLMGLMQVGGLGIMTATTLLGMVVARRLRLRSRLLVQTEAASTDLGAVRGLLAGVLQISLAIEAVAWLAISLRLFLGYGESAGRAAYLGLFHAVSAFNNGGFALWPDSLTRFGGDAVMLTPIAAAFLLGAIGYPVLLELRRRVPMSAWSLHTRLTVVAFAVVAGTGTVLVLIAEISNPASVGVHGGLGPRLVAGVFSGLTAGSAGFNVIDYGAVDPATRLVTDALTFIGGGSAGTAGGIKLTTVAVLTMAIVAEVRGDQDVAVFGRRLSAATVRQALAVALLGVAAVAGGTLLMLELAPVGLDAALFEVVSALSSGGLSTGITADLPQPAQYLLVVLMAVGRIGPVTVATSLALRSSRRLYRYPEARPLVG